jgi:hypothetical protein
MWHGEYTPNAKNSHKNNLTELHCLKLYRDLIFQENPNPESEIGNSLSGTFYGHICVSATFWEILTSPNQIIWSGIRTHFSRRIWIWSQKFQIQPIGSTVCIFLVSNIYISHYAITMDATIKITHRTSCFMQGTCVYTLNDHQEFLLSVPYHRLHKNANNWGTLGQIEYIAQSGVFRSSMTLKSHIGHATIYKGHVSTHWMCIRKCYYKYHITDYTRMQITGELWDKWNI